MGIEAKLLLPPNDRQAVGSFDWYVRGAIRDLQDTPEVPMWTLAWQRGLHYVLTSGAPVEDRLSKAILEALRHGAEHLPEGERAGFVKQGGNHHIDELSRTPLKPGRDLGGELADNTPYTIEATLLLPDNNEQEKGSFEWFLRGALGHVKDTPEGAVWTTGMQAGRRYLLTTGLPVENRLTNAVERALTATTEFYVQADHEKVFCLGMDQYRAMLSEHPLRWEGTRGRRMARRPAGPPNTMDGVTEIHAAPPAGTQHTGVFPLPKAGRPRGKRVVAKVRDALKLNK